MNRGWSVGLAAGILAAASALAEKQAPSPFQFRAEESLKRLRHFVETRMTGPMDAIRVNAVTNRVEKSGEARNTECLSETVGQRMELALLENDRQTFDQQLDLAMKKFAGPSGLLAWKISGDLATKAESSATIDDWRVALACRMAFDRWQRQAAFDYGLKVSTVLANTIQETGLMPVALDIEKGRGERERLPLCYLHLPAMKSWEPFLTTLSDARKRATAVLINGRRRPGLLAEAWHPTHGGYSEGKADEVLTLIALLYLQEMDPQSALVKEAIAKRVALLKLSTPLPQAFDTVSGNGEQEPAGAAVYALLSRLLTRANDMKHAEAALKRMLEFQNPPDDRFDGAIGKEPVFSFDQIEAMLALREYLNMEKGAAGGEPSAKPSMQEK